MINVAKRKRFVLNKEGKLSENENLTLRREDLEGT
jgi:hypothetical protein